MSIAALVLNHLWQSTVFVLPAALVTILLKSARARTRYWIWLAASLKFFVPFSLIVLAGSQIHWRSESIHVARSWPTAMTRVSEPFPASTITPSVPVTHSGESWGRILFLVWGVGFFLVLGLWVRRWNGIRKILQSAAPCELPAPLRIRSSSALLEPAVFGIFKPVLLLPEGLLGRLSAKELQAIYAHELCHVRHRDNLAASAHMLVEAIFWFHPLVWWLEKRLIAERECACDEEVLRAGNDAQDYAEGILSVCKFCLASPIPCAAGVSGADLRRRIETIMSERIGRELTTPKKLLLAVAGVIAITAPVTIGLAKDAQRYAFDVASIKPSDPAANGMMVNGFNTSFSAKGITPKVLIENAYDLHGFQIEGGPNWLDSARYDIEAKAEGPPPKSYRQMTQNERELNKNQSEGRLQALLADRFALKIHRATKDLTIYALTVAKNGPKLQPTKGFNPKLGYGMRIEPGLLTGQELSMEFLVANLSNLVNRIVLDKTGITGEYDLTLRWKPEENRADPIHSQEPAAASESSGPSLFTAVQEQLGLKLVPQKGPVKVLVIDHIEKPSPN